MLPDMEESARRLVREDGSVVIPPQLAGAVLRILLRDVGARCRTGDGKVSSSVSGLFWALNEAAEQAEARDGSTPGTPGTAPGSVELSTTEAARELGCSESYVRRLARAGRLRGRKVGPMWLVAQATIVAPERTENAA